MEKSFDNALRDMGTAMEDLNAVRPSDAEAIEQLSKEAAICTAVLMAYSCLHPQLESDNSKRDTAVTLLKAFSGRCLELTTELSEQKTITAFATRRLLAQHVEGTMEHITSITSAHSEVIRETTQRSTGPVDFLRQKALHLLGGTV